MGVLKGTSGLIKSTWYGSVLWKRIEGESFIHNKECYINVLNRKVYVTY